MEFNLSLPGTALLSRKHFQVENVLFQSLHMWLKTPMKWLCLEQSVIMMSILTGLQIWWPYIMDHIFFYQNHAFLCMHFHLLNHISWYRYLRFTSFFLSKTPHWTFFMHTSWPTFETISSGYISRNRIGLQCQNLADSQSQLTLSSVLT